MTAPSSSPSGVDSYGSPTMGILRLMGFFLLIIALVLPQLIYYLIKPKNPFYVSQLFYRVMMKIMGFHLRIHGTMATQKPVLFVCNHASYLDIPVLGALIPAAFVAKAEVASWPLIGGLAKLQNTVFIERRSSQISGQRNYLRSHLARRHSLILFPEGTSSIGQTVLPFKSALFSIVEEKLDGIDIIVQPVSVICTGLDGMPMTRNWRSFYAWYGDMTLVSHLWNVFCIGHFTMDIVFHPAIAPTDFANRKELSSYCQHQVAQGVELCLTGRSPDVAASIKRLAAPASKALLLGTSYMPENNI